MSHWTREFLGDLAASLDNPTLVLTGRCYQGQSLQAFIRDCHEGLLEDIGRQLNAIESETMIREARAREWEADANVDYSGIHELHEAEARAMIETANAAAKHRDSTAGRLEAIAERLERLDAQQKART